MRDSLWLGATALVIAIMALGLGIAALVLALDDDDPGFIERRFSSGITPGGPGFPDGRGNNVVPVVPFPIPERQGGALPERSPGTVRPLLGVTVGATDSADGAEVDWISFENEGVASIQLAPGSYLVRVNIGTQQAAQARFEVSPGETTSLALTLTP